MPSPEIFILRHGETEWNVAARMQGWLDSPLTPRGRQQAAHQRDILHHAGADRLPVWCSTAGRARATAAIALPDAQPTFDERLREITLGPWDGLDAGQIAALGSQPPSRFGEAEGFWWYDTTPGERLAGIAARVASFLDGLRGPAVIVTHGMTSRFLRGRLLGLDLAGIAALTSAHGVVWHLHDGREEILA